MCVLDERMKVCEDSWMGDWIFLWMDGRVNGCMVWMDDGCVGRLIDGCVVCVEG